MKNPLNPLWGLALALFLVQAPRLNAQETALQPNAALAHLGQETSTTTHPTSEEEDDREWMRDGLYLASQTMGINEADLFSALAHGLSMAEVARAHGINPIDILDIALSFEESDILADLLHEEINLGDAEDWRDAAAEDSAWLLYQEDPFGLEEIVWILDGTAEACELNLLELADWMNEGVSIQEIAAEREIELDVVSDFALDYLEDSLDILVLLEEIDPQEAGEWLGWSEETLEELLTDEALFETIAEEAWAAEMVEILEELMGLEEDALWDLLEQGEDLTGLLDSHKIDIQDENLAAEINEFLDWWNDDDFEAEQNSDREDL